jgi:hypothetical protein
MGFSRTPDGRLDRSHPWQQGPNWQNLNDKVEWERAAKQGAPEQRQMAIAMYCADPDTPNEVIRELLTNPAFPPRYGYDREVPGIADILQVRQPPSHSLFDYSGTDHSQESSMRPGLHSAGSP